MNYIHVCTTCRNYFSLSFFFGSFTIVDTVLYTHPEEQCIITTVEEELIYTVYNKGTRISLALDFCRQKAFSMKQPEAANAHPETHMPASQTRRKKDC